MSLFSSSLFSLSFSSSYTRFASSLASLFRSTLEKLFLSLDAVEARLQFVSLHEKSGVDHPALQEFLEAESCKPRFVLLLNGNVVGNVEGALSPAVHAAITDNLPEQD
jgi:hypothetical protein